LVQKLLSNYLVEYNNIGWLNNNDPAINPAALRLTVKLPKHENWQYCKEWLPMNAERIWAYYPMGW